MREVDDAVSEVKPPSKPTARFRGWCSHVYDYHLNPLPLRRMEEGNPTMTAINSRTANRVNNPTRKMRTKKRFSMLRAFQNFEEKFLTSCRGSVALLVLHPRYLRVERNVHYCVARLSKNIRTINASTINVSTFCFSRYVCS